MSQILKKFVRIKKKFIHNTQCLIFYFPSLTNASFSHIKINYKSCIYFSRVFFEVFNLLIKLKETHTHTHLISLLR